MNERRFRAVLCEDDRALRLASAVILDSYGFDLVGVVGSGREALLAAATARPDVVVLDVALSGELRLGIVPALLLAAPGCSVILLSCLSGLERAALAAGATAVVGTSDLRALERCLQQAGCSRRRRAAAGADRRFQHLEALWTDN